MERMRTIKESIKLLREEDPGTCVTTWWLRQLVLDGKIPAHRVGDEGCKGKFLISYDALLNYLACPPVEKKTDAETIVIGKLRKVKERAVCHER